MNKHSCKDSIPQVSNELEEHGGGWKVRAKAVMDGYTEEVELQA